MIRLLVVLSIVISFLTGCPLSTLPHPPSPMVTNSAMYPRVVPPPVIDIYLDPKLHIDKDGLEQYRKAIQDYRAYLEQYERILTKRYYLTPIAEEPETTVLAEPKIIVQEKIVYVDRPVTTEAPVASPSTCRAVPCKRSFEFTPLTIPKPPVFKVNQDTDHVIIEGLTSYIEDLVELIQRHNEDHTVIEE